MILPDDPTIRELAKYVKDNSAYPYLGPDAIPLQIAELNVSTYGLFGARAQQDLLRDYGVSGFNGQTFELLNIAIQKETAVDRSHLDNSCPTDPEPVYVYNAEGAVTEVSTLGEPEEHPDNQFRDSEAV